MTRLRHDLDFLTTVGLLATVVATALTGVIADLWDLNDFWYHTVSGYVMGVVRHRPRAAQLRAADRLRALPLALDATPRTGRRLPPAETPRSQPDRERRGRAAGLAVDVRTCAGLSRAACSG